MNCTDHQDINLIHTQPSNGKHVYVYISHSLKRQAWVLNILVSMVLFYGYKTLLVPTINTQKYIWVTTVNMNPLLDAFCDTFSYQLYLHFAGSALQHAKLYIHRKSHLWNIFRCFKNLIIWALRVMTDALKVLEIWRCIRKY